MGRFEELQNGLRIRRYEEGMFGPRPGDSSLFTHLHADLVSTSSAADFTETQGVAGYIANTLVLRGDRGDFTIDERYQYRIMNRGPILFGRRRLFQGWLVSEWDTNVPPEELVGVTDGVEKRSVRGLLLSSAAVLATLDYAVNTGDSLPQKLAFSAAEAARSFTPFETAEHAQSVDNIDIHLARFALDKRISLADL